MRDLVDSELGIDAVAEEEDDDVLEVTALSDDDDDEGADSEDDDYEEEPHNDLDVDSDAVCAKAEKAIAVAESRPPEQRGANESHPRSPGSPNPAKPTDPKAPTRQDPDNNSDGYDDGGVDSVDLDFGLDV